MTRIGASNFLALEHFCTIFDLTLAIKKVHLDDLVVLEMLKFALIISGETCKEV